MTVAETVHTANLSPATAETKPSQAPWHIFSAPQPEGDPAGAGVIHLSNPSRATFATQRASYPLKFLTPIPLPSQPPNVGVIYSIAYGGGLVAGDTVRIDSKVDEGCTLVLLTQGSTKVYKQRVGLRPQSNRLRHEKEDTPDPITRQRMQVRVDPGGVLLLLPDSISPFRDSRYVQAQRVELALGASALVLDWVNSGRGQRPAFPTRVTARGRWRKWGDVKERKKVQAERDRLEAGEPVVKSDEQDQTAGVEQTLSDTTTATDQGVPDTEIWAMSYYASSNEIVDAAGTVIARERMVLDNAEHDTRNQGSSLSPVALRLAPYHVYATVLVYGPHLAALRTALEQLCDQTSQFQIPQPPGLLWSYSPLSEDGGILRVAGVEVEDIRDWLRVVFEAGGVKDFVGDGLWPRCI